MLQNQVRTYFITPIQDAVNHDYYLLELVDCNSSSSQKNKYLLSCATNEQVINPLYTHTVMMQALFTQLIDDKPAHPMNPKGI